MSLPRQALALALLGAHPLWAAPLHQGPPVLTRAPYLQCATPTSMCVVWRTDQRITPVVRFGLRAENLDRQVGGPAIITRMVGSASKKEQRGEPIAPPRLHSAPAGTFQYEAHLTGLAPDTPCFYLVCDADRPLTPRSPDDRFRTSPTPGAPRPIRFGAFGDSGTGREKQRRVWQALLGHTAREGRPMDFFLHLGDMAYDRGRDHEFSTRFFAPYEATLRQMVFWPTFANHEAYTSKGTTGVGPYFDAFVCPTNGQAGGAPSGHEGFYSFDYGPAHFICLNSHDEDRRPTGRMAQWLQRDLAQTRARWIIAFFHHPPYSKGSHDSDREKPMIEMRAHLMPLLEAGGVDLVLAAHSHIYERSMLMDGAYATPTTAAHVILDDGDGDPRGDGPYARPAGRVPNAGTVYVVAGHGGATLRRKSTSPVMRKTIVDHGSLLVDIEGDVLTARMVDLNGDVRDTFSIVKRGAPALTRLASPWQPPPWSASKVSSRREEPRDRPPADGAELIPRHAEWHYLAGAHPSREDWAKPGFDARGWHRGKTGVGYPATAPAVRTVLEDMRGRYAVVYLRREFDVPDVEAIAGLGLWIAYHDAFIAYLNGREVLRHGVGKGRGSKARDITPRPLADQGKMAYYPIRDFKKHLRPGRNVLALEGHNARLDSPGFLLDPVLIVEN